MDIKKFYLGEFIHYEKHESSYFHLPASVAVLIAYMLPGFLGLIHVNLSYFATLSLIVVALFEKRSDMVRFYCFQFCVLTMFFNILHSILSLLGMLIPIVELINALLSIITAFLILFAFFYSWYRALQYKAWVIPWVGNIVLNTFMKITVQ